MVHSIRNVFIKISDDLMAKYHVQNICLLIIARMCLLNRHKIIILDLFNINTARTKLGLNKYFLGST